MKIAFDAALLVPKEIEVMCIRTNQTSKTAFDTLNRKDSFAHITLVMGVIEEKDLPAAKKAVQKAVIHIAPLALEVTGTHVSTNPDGKRSASLRIAKTPELIELYMAVATALNPFLTFSPEPSMFFKKRSETISEVSTVWVEKPKDTNGHPHLFKPHISLKCGTVPEVKLLIKFSANRIALCHLGNYCTCRKILFLAKLTG